MFLLGFKKLVSPLADIIEQRLNAIPKPTYRTVLRPPGALDERQFLDTCYRSGNCIDACPAHAIRPMSTGDAERAGTPYLDADLAACTVCEDLSCMKTCPSGALRKLESANQIRIGMARVNHHICVRSRGEDCRICIEKCPLGEKAIAISAGGAVAVIVPGCIGCGMCQLHCPTLPKAIVVDPS